MPRKTSQSSKKESTGSKNEGVTPRRSGRAATKQETTPVKDASRSRRSSTAAQTVASVADSKSPRGRSSRRESSSPSDSRSRSGLESPATRVRSTRRNTGPISYKESDGEEETPTPKYDEAFEESGEEFEESDSDEKLKPRAKGKQTKASSKNESAKEKTEKRTRGRRGRPSKKKVEEVKTLEISDDSMEPEIVETKPAKSETKESTRTGRGRKPKTEVVDVESEVKPKPSRRSARSTSNKEETPNKRPTRSIQAKRYTEDDEEDIEEIGDAKAEEEIDGTRKRKRESSPEETNKRVKEEESGTKEKTMETEEETEKLVEETKKVVEETKKPVEEEKITCKEQVEEPMEVEECDSGIVSQDDSKSQEKELTSSAEDKATLDSEKKIENVSEKKDVSDGKEPSSSEKAAEVKLSETKQDIQSSAACDSKVSEDMKEKENIPDPVISENKPENQIADVVSNQTPEKPQPMDCVSSESEKSQTPNLVQETNSEPLKLDAEKEDLKNAETPANDINESKNCESKTESSVSQVALESIVPAANAHSASDNSDSSLNGTERLSNSVCPNSIAEAPSINMKQSETVVPKANGAHDVHENTNSVKEQCALPGRKYAINSKLNENILQSVKNKTFGFSSYNLGPDFNVQKEKLLHELHELNSQIICLQQVPKPFYTSVLEPSLDALGFKGVFSQPEDSLKGMATFFKTSQFRLNDKVEISLRQLIDKELETSALEPSSKAAVKSFVKRCGNALLTHFASVVGTETINVLNVQIPPSDLSAHALQVSSLAREVMRINGGTNKPLLIGGEFNISENDASYQLLRDGYLSNDMIDELQRRKDIAVPEKENSSLVDLLWKSFQHPSSNLCSCYSSVLDHELLIPELKKTSSDLLWYSSDSLHTVGIVDVDSNKLGDRHFSLKADIAFSV